MMRNKKILPLLLAALLCGCSGGKEAEVTTVSESGTVTTTVNEYALVRFWTADELLDSIFCCGEFRPLPFDPEETEGFTFSDGILIFPDGSYAAAEMNEDGEIVSLRMEAMSAPLDFSVYGIGFDSVPEDIYEYVGIPDAVSGSVNESIVYTFYGGGISALSFLYTDRMLEGVYIKC